VKDRGNTGGQVKDKQVCLNPAPAEALMLKQLVASTSMYCGMKAFRGFCSALAIFNHPYNGFHN
jgi:hypothetical protein